MQPESVPMSRSYASFCAEQRRRFHPKAHGRANYEARIAYHERRARALLADAKHHREAAGDVIGWQLVEWERCERAAKGHKRQAIYLMQAGNRGERWTDSTPERMLAQ